MLHFFTAACNLCFLDNLVINKLGNSVKEAKKQSLELDNVKEKHEMVKGNGLESLKQVYDSSENEESDHEAGVLQGFSLSLFLLNHINLYLSKVRNDGRSFLPVRLIMRFE